LPAWRPIGAKGWVIGFVAVSMIVEGFHVISEPRGVFVDYPKHRTGAGRYLRLVPVSHRRRV
jgi:DNA-binding cell septation regulator SpoVG